MKNLEIRKNDVVIVIAGNSRGKEGKILKVINEKSRVIVEGVNILKKHTRPSQTNPQGGVVEREASIHISNVMLKCPKTGKQTRVGHKMSKDAVSGKKKMLRISRKSGEII